MMFIAGFIAGVMTGAVIALWRVALGEWDD